MKETIGVIGANGFVGMHLVEEICNNYPQYDVVAFVYKINSGKTGFSARVKEVREIDVLNKEALPEKLQGIDILIFSVKGDNKTIVDGLKNTLESIKNTAIKKIIYLSSIVVFGENPSEDTNDDSPLLQIQGNEYNMAKVKAENYVEAFRKDGINIITIRPGYIYGENGLDHTIYFLNQIKEEFRNFYLPNKGKGIFNGVYVKNLVHMIMCAVESNVKNQNFNGVDGFKKTWYELFESYSQFLNKDIDKLILNSERRGVIIVGNNIISRIIAKIKKAFFPGRILISKEIYDIYSCGHYFTAKKAESLLGYKPAFSFAKAMENIKNWAIAVDIELK
jgi:nucleoside-diphosphate-sugar epimerase